MRRLGCDPRWVKEAPTWWLKNLTEPTYQASGGEVPFLFEARLQLAPVCNKASLILIDVDEGQRFWISPKELTSIAQGGKRVKPVIEGRAVFFQGPWRFERDGRRVLIVSYEDTP
jgi:hypothetical protein